MSRRVCRAVYFAVAGLTSDEAATGKMPCVCWFPAEIVRSGREITGKCHRTLLPACCVTIAAVSPQRGLPGWCSRDRRAVVPRQIVAFRLSAKRTPLRVHASFARTDSALIGSRSWTRTPAPPRLFQCVSADFSRLAVSPCGVSPCGVSPCGVSPVVCPRVVCPRAAAGIGIQMSQGPSTALPMRQSSVFARDRGSLPGFAFVFLDSAG